MEKASRIVLGLELSALVILFLFAVPVYLMGPLLSEENFGLLSKLSHFAAVVSFVSVAFLGLGYIRTPAREFSLQLDVPWTVATIGVALVLLYAIYGIATNTARIMDVVACLVALPFFHVVVAGYLGR